MPIQIDKKPSHRSSGSSENKFLIGDNTQRPKEFAANVNGNEDPALIYDPISLEWYLIRNQADRDAFEAGTLTPLGPGPTGPAGIDGQTGPQGITGMMGPTGMTGTQGVTGTKGDTGTQGQTGVAGDTGLAVQGVTGQKGETGIQGVTGSGVQGATGTQGVAGATGVQGTQGDTGTQGVAGATGTQGTQGDTGLTGETGVQGDTGIKGTTGVGSPTTFVSTEQTGTGSSQDIAHGLGVTPTKVLVSVTDNTASSTFTVTEGAHDSTDVKITLTTGVKYKVLAMA